MGFLQKYFKNSKVTQKSEENLNIFFPTEVYHNALIKHFECIKTYSILKGKIKVTIQNHNSRFLISRTEEIGENTQNKKTVFFQYHEKLSKIIREMLLTT